MAEVSFFCDHPDHPEDVAFQIRQFKGEIPFREIRFDGRTIILETADATATRMALVEHGYMENPDG